MPALIANIIPILIPIAFKVAPNLLVVEEADWIYVSISFMLRFPESTSVRN